MEETKEIGTEPTTIKELLERTVKATQRLDEEAHTALWGSRNTTEYRAMLRRRAELITELPERVEKLVQQGETIPTHEVVAISNLAFMANEALEKDNVFALSVLLFKKGSKTNDPNQLEQILQRLYPPKSS